MYRGKDAMNRDPKTPELRRKTCPVFMKKIGRDGALLDWPRYIDDRRWFNSHVHRLVQQAGLR